MRFSDTFQAMGTTVDVLVDAESRPIDAFVSIRLLFEQQQMMFSRFNPESLLSRLNAGETVEHPAFALCCRLALEGHQITEGIFNPMVLTALRHAGYDRTFERLSGGCAKVQTVPDPGECLIVEGDRVRLAHGQLDLGGIAKGWTVDLAIELLRGWIERALVNAGGDLRCYSAPGEANRWPTEIEGPDGRAIWEGWTEGALATSSRQKRRWLSDSGELMHHLIDPRTGLPAHTSLEQVSAWGPTTWLAEVWAKAILIGDSELEHRALSEGISLLKIGADPVPELTLGLNATVGEGSVSLLRS